MANPIFLKKETPSKSAHIIDARFGDFGGQYAPEALVDCLEEIERAFVDAKNDPTFWEEFRSYYPYIGRPSSLHKAERLSKEAGMTTLLKYFYSSRFPIMF
jgi:tryptophan synthase